MPWTEESRAKEAARIRARKPWLQSTGPRTEDGKSRSSRNADKGHWRPQVRALGKLLQKIESRPDGGDSS